MSMLHPLGLCLLPLIALMVWFSCPADAKGRRRWPEGLVSWLLILRGAALVCLVLAMTGPALTLPAERQDLMVLIDVSDSQGPGLTEKARGAALTVVRGLASDSRATVLAFAGDARVIAGPGSPSTVAAELETASLALKDGSQTDIRAAFMLAASLNDRAAGTPVVWLFSDGKPTRGGGLEDLATIDLGGPLFAVPLGQAAKRLVSTGLEPPAVVRPGERALVRWSFRSPDRRRVAVRLLLDGEAAGNPTLELRAGEGSAELSLAVPDAGSHRLDLVVYDESGRELVPARISALVEVSGPARILVIHGDGETSPLVPVLRTQGMQVSEAGTEG